MTKVQTLAKTHPLLVVAFFAVLVVVAGGAFAANSMLRIEPVNVNYDLPQAPTLTATGPNQTVYRIDASRSSVSYEIKERLAGVPKTTTGKTQGIAGDLLIDEANPAASQVGEMVVNVQQLTSDDALRDSRVRGQFLQSAQYPEARFKTTSLTGMPDRIVDATPYRVRLAGDLTVRRATKPAVFEATARRENGVLQVTATTTVKLSAFDVGPINIIGLVSTDDDALLRLDLVAPKASDLVLAQKASTSPATAPTVGGPSFAKTVQPVLEKSCASCHNAGGSGSSQWKLDNAGDASKFATGLGLVTNTRYMPPWPASDTGIPLQHSLKMSDHDVAAVVDWAKAGGPLDIDPTTPVRATPKEQRTPRTDLDLKMPEPYQSTPDLRNDYRCFSLDPKLAAPAMVTGYQFIPDQTKIVHHALVYRIRGTLRDAAAEADAKDAKPGWECFGALGIRGTTLSPTGSDGASELVMGWAPGQMPGVYPTGTGLRLDPGDTLVMQIHYNTPEPSPPDRSALSLEVAPDDIANYKNVRVTTYLAPAEIPCAPGETGPMCDRRAAIADIEKKYGPNGPIISDGLNLVCGTKPEQLAVLDDQKVARSSCDSRVRRNSEIVSVLGHMHEIGKSFRMTLNPGKPDEKILLDIPRWDFSWQFNYAPVETIQLKAGDVIRVECSWDRNLMKPGEPRYVTWAEGTEDEMCFSTIAAVDNGPQPPEPTRSPGGARRAAGG